MNELMQAVSQDETIAIGGHVRPDGDCIGSCMGLYSYILDNFPGKKVTVYVEEIPSAFDYLSKEEEMTAADYIYSQGKRLESLSYKLLDLFVLQQGQKPESPVKMEKVGEETKEIMAPVLAKKQQRLTLWMEPFTLTGEKDLLISLLCNLIDNARKASGEGKEITVRGTKEEDGYQLTVADEGKGIPTEEIHKIFAPFYMVDKSRSRKEGGAGLGMSLCAEILRLHGAQWKIESK